MSKMYPTSQRMIGIMEDVEISRIDQPSRPLRTDFENIGELGDSIQEKGLLQPIVVRVKSEKSFEIVAGSRRFHACKRLGWRKIPCHVVDLEDREAFEISLIENVQRNSMNPIDEGLAFKNYVTEYGWGGTSDLARKIGKSPSYVTKRIQLLDLPSNVIESVVNSNLYPSVAEELCQLKNKDKQAELAEAIAKGKLSVANSRELIKKESKKFSDLQNMPIYQKTERDKKRKINQNIRQEHYFVENHNESLS